MGGDDSNEIGFWFIVPAFFEAGAPQGPGVSYQLLPAQLYLV